MIRDTPEFQSKIYITKTIRKYAEDLEFLRKAKFIAKLSILNINAMAILHQPQHVTLTHGYTDTQIGRELQQFELFVSSVSLSMMSFEQNAFLHPCYLTTTAVDESAFFILSRVGLMCVYAHTCYMITYLHDLVLEFSFLSISFSFSSFSSFHPCSYVCVLICKCIKVKELHGNNNNCTK